MIIIKNSSQISAMREANKISAEALATAGEAIKAGVSTQHVDRLVKKFITSHGATPSFLGYGGFPASTCISINDTVIHGIPTDTVIIKDGDIVSVDVGAYFKGYHGDNAFTFPVGDISPVAKKLIEVTKESLQAAISVAGPDKRIGDISAAVQAVVEAAGFSVVTDFVGHGVGADLHEDPQVPNYGVAGRGPRLTAGMTLAVEPMVNEGTAKVRVLPDEWTVKTVDGKLSAHFEHTILITPNGCEILTAI